MSKLIKLNSNVETVILDLDTQSGVVLKGHLRERSIVGFEKKQVIDNQSAVKVFSRELDKLKHCMTLKEPPLKNNATLFSKVLSYLVNTNIDKYYLVVKFWIADTCNGSNPS